MHPGTIRAKKKTVLASALVLAVGLAFPAQAYLLDLTVSSINPGACISHAGGYPSRPPPVGNHLKIIDVSLTGELTHKVSPAIAFHNRILNCQTPPLADYLSNVLPATSIWTFGAISPQGTIILQGGLASLDMTDGTTLLSGSFGTANVTEPASVWVKLFVYLADSNFTDHKNDALITYFGMPRPTATDNFTLGLAASFAPASGALISTTVPSANILDHLAHFFPTLLLLGSGLMGLVGLGHRRRGG